MATTPTVPFPDAVTVTVIAMDARRLVRELIHGLPPAAFGAGSGTDRDVLTVSRLRDPGKGCIDTGDSLRPPGSGSTPS